MNDETFGLRDAGSFSISGTWDDGAAILRVFDEQRAIVIPARVRRLWCDWYPEFYTFTMTTARESSGETADGEVTVEITMSPTSAVQVVQAEWWRRIGYRVFSRFEPQE